MTILPPERIAELSALTEKATPGRELLDAIFTLTDPSNWDAMRGATYRGYHDAMTAVHEAAAEWQSDIYAAEKDRAALLSSHEALRAEVERLNDERDNAVWSNAILEEKLRNLEAEVERLRAMAKPSTDNIWLQGGSKAHEKRGQD